MYHPRTPNDFRNFLYLVWKHLRLPEPTGIQYDIAHYLQHGPKRLVIEAFRGVGKSWITAAYVCWILDHHPNWNVLVVSASKARSDDFSTFTLRLIHEMNDLRHLIPGDTQRNSKISFDVAPAPPSHAPSVKSLGITSQLTGSRADVIIPDDIEVPNNSQTQLMRDRLSEQVKEFDSIVKPGGRILFLGTPQNEQTVYNKLAERGYDIRIWPGRFPTAAQQKTYGERLAPYILLAQQQPGGLEGGEEGEAPRRLLEGHPTDPRRFSDLDLREREASYGRAGFMLQFMLDTNLSDLDRYPLKIKDLIIMSCDPDKAPEKVVWANSPELVRNDLPCVAMAGDRFYRPMTTVGHWLDYTGCVMTIDPSGRGKDELAYSIVKMLHGQLFVVACRGLLGGYSEENLKALAEAARIHHVKHIQIESNFGDGMFTALFKPVLAKAHAVTVDEVRHNKQKELRIIDTLEPVMAAHKLIIDAAVIEEDYRSTQLLPTETAHQYQLIHQMTRITRDRGSLAHDDRLDSLAMAVAYWVEQMSKDIDDAVLDARSDKLDEELEKFMAHAIGRSGQGSGEKHTTTHQPTWMKVGVGRSCAPR